MGFNVKLVVKMTKLLQLKYENRIERLSYHAIIFYREGNMSEYTRKINRGYQVTLPQEFRDNYHLQVGDYLRINEVGGKLIIEPVKIVPKNSVEALQSIFSSINSDLDDLPEDEIMELVRKEIKRSRKKSQLEPKRKK